MQTSRVELTQWEESERPITGRFFVVVGGILVPLVILLWGLSCVVRQEALLMGPRGGTMLYGIDAIAMGVALIALGGVIHFQCFWDGLYDSTCASARGKLTCLLLMGLCSYFLCFRMLPGLF
jgi:hypothetical protein